MKTNKSNFATNLEIRLKQQKIKQKSFAKRLGISNATISNYVNGHREPRLIVLAEIAKILETTADRLLESSAQSGRDTERQSKKQNLKIKENIAKVL